MVRAKRGITSNIASIDWMPPLLTDEFSLPKEPWMSTDASLNTTPGLFLSQATAAPQAKPKRNKNRANLTQATVRMNHHRMKTCRMTTCTKHNRQCAARCRLQRRKNTIRKNLQVRH